MTFSCLYGSDPIQYLGDAATRAGLVLAVVGVLVYPPLYCRIWFSLDREAESSSSGGTAGKDHLGRGA